MSPVPRNDHFPSAARQLTEDRAARSKLTDVGQFLAAGVSNHFSLLVEIHAARVASSAGGADRHGEVARYRATSGWRNVEIRT